MCSFESFLLQSFGEVVQDNAKTQRVLVCFLLTSRECSKPQQRHTVCMTGSGSHIGGGVTLAVDSTGVSVALEERAGDENVALVCSNVKRGPPVVVTDAHIRSVHQQQPQTGQISNLCSVMQSCTTLAHVSKKRSIVNAWAYLPGFHDHAH